MPHKGPHISISADFVVNRILRINLDEFEDWPESVRHLAIEIAEELFLVVYNPFIDAETVKASVRARFEGEKAALAHHYATSIGEGITMFWSAHEAEVAYRDELVKRMAAVMPRECIDTRPGALVENSTDATDLRMELPMLVVSPASAEQVSAVVKLANELKFAIIPRGGGSGLTGGAVPARKRTVILSLGRLTRIVSIDEQNKVLCCEAGVITNDAIVAAGKKGLLFTVDPASKLASSIGGNIAENAGGPFAFEYGTTLDNLLSWRMVTPTGEIIDVARVDHPRHKIMPGETATFEIRDLSGGVRNVVSLRGDEIRLPGLGKDVTNKTLGGLPGMQKEGVDGIIVEACFVLHKKPTHQRVLVLEFFGRSMNSAMQVIKDVVGYRDTIRREGDHVKISALEEFNSKYVKAIEYKKKSTEYEGDPISVLIVQLDGDDEFHLDRAVHQILDIVNPYDGADIFAARDEKEAEVFWEDRHKLSAIARRTSGFKINEDVVIPIDGVPEFADFLEQVNLECAAAAYRSALQEVGRLAGMPLDDKEFNREFTYASKVAKGEVSAKDISDEEMQIRAVVFLGELGNVHANLARKIERIKDHMQATRIEVASHMHAGDGNCHVNIPVNSNDPVMLHNAEQVAHRVMAKAQEVGGEVSGEHGIGITKIAFLRKEKMDALRAFKERVDPRNVLNPAKLTQRELPVRPFTFSFNRLIEDIRQSGLPDKERLIALLANVQICTRCGKCKQVCPMFYPEQSLQYHPRNKNIALGALVEAVYYSQVNKGRPDPFLLGELRTMMEHCTGCGRCTSVCPVKIDSSGVALAMRAFLESENAGGHPIKRKVLEWLSADPASRVPRAAKAASMGQRFQNRFVGLVPAGWRERFESPLFAGPGPEVGYKNLAETLHLGKGGIFVPASARERARQQGTPVEAVFYFPGCGAGLFYRNIGLAGLMLMLKSGVAVVMPEQHLCCGYPLLSAGADNAFATNRDRNVQVIRTALDKARAAGLAVTHVITACGSCRDGIQRHELLGAQGTAPTRHMDMVQFLLERLPAEALSGAAKPAAGTEVLYHPSCHAEWVGVHKGKAANLYAQAVAAFTGAKVRVNPGCCGESGMGAMTSPAIYNKLRARKRMRLEADFMTYADGAPVIVGCPSCKVGIKRTMLALKDKRPVLHTLEWLAELAKGADWRKLLRKAADQARDEGGVRVVDDSTL